MKCMENSKENMNFHVRAQRVKLASSREDRADHLLLPNKSLDSQQHFHALSSNDSRHVAMDSP